LILNIICLIIFSGESSHMLWESNKKYWETDYRWYIILKSLPLVPPYCYVFLSTNERCFLGRWEHCMLIDLISVIITHSKTRYNSHTLLSKFYTALYTHFNIL
jgi:hypothetical protein